MPIETAQQNLRHFSLAKTIICVGAQEAASDEGNRSVLAQNRLRDQLGHSQRALVATDVVVLKELAGLIQN